MELNGAPTGGQRRDDGAVRTREGKKQGGRIYHRDHRERREDAREQIRGKTMNEQDERLVRALRGGAERTCPAAAGKRNGT